MIFAGTRTVTPVVGHPAATASNASVDADEGVDVEHLAAGLGVDAGGHGAPPATPRVDPAMARSAARSVLRRWAKAASTTAKTCSRVAVVAGGSRRVQATRPESTLGAGQKTCRPIAPARRTSANHAALTDGMP